MPFRLLSRVWSMVVESVQRIPHSRGTGAAVPLPDQIAIISEMGLSIEPGATDDDWTAWHSQDELEAQPFDLLLPVLGSELRRRPYSPICRELWLCDYECITGRNDYGRIIDRLSNMTGHMLALSNISEVPDPQKGIISIQFQHEGQQTEWQAAISDDWLDPYIIVKFDALLAAVDSPMRIYSNHSHYGQSALLAGLTSSQKSAFNDLFTVPIYPIAEQA